MCDCLIPSLPLAVGVGVGGPTGSVKPERTRRSWTKREEEVLIIALHDIVAGGWKADNGFRPGHSKMIYACLNARSLIPS